MLSARAALRVHRIASEQSRGLRAEPCRFLSQRRADTVRSYLISQGIPAANITAVGMGESQPVVQCANTARQALVDCLQPNRRVEVEVTTR